MKFVGRPIVTFVRRNALQIVLAFAAPALLWFFTQRESRKLSVVLVANVPVVSLDARYSDSVTVRYGTREITALSVLEFVVENAGNRPIRRTDFDMPLRVVFDGRIVGQSAPLFLDQSNLRPVLTVVPPDTVLVEPLLLNPGDRFGFRIFVVDARSSQVTAQVFARISGIPRVVLKLPNEDDERAVPSPIIIAVIITVSVLSAFSVIRQVGTVMRLRNAIGTLESPLRNDPTDQSETPIEKLADELGIKDHDVKANLMLLRLKLEEQLRILARAADLGSQYERGSILTLVRALEQDGRLSHELAAGIKDLAPIMNRELHEISAYASDTDLGRVQNGILNAITLLERESQRKSASVHVRLEKEEGWSGAGVHYSVVVSNRGSEDARDVDLEFLNRESPIPENEAAAKLPVQNLPPEVEYKLVAAISKSNAPPFRVVAYWSDSRGRQQKEFPLT